MLNQGICDHILRYGEVIRDTETELADGWYRQYIVKMRDGDTYHMTKHNGVWIYIRRGREV
jgi:hypothetical protein